MPNSSPDLSNLPDTRDATLQLLTDYGALEQGHFLLASGRHSAFYINKTRLVEWPHVVDAMIRNRLARLRELGRIDVVLSPAMGGVPVGQQVGLVLQARAIYAERGADNSMGLKRGFEVRPGERVLLVEDVITTGGTLRELRGFIQAQGGEIAGVFALVNRSGSPQWQGLPLVSCLEIEFPTYLPDEVPAELSAVALTKPGTKQQANATA